MRWTPALTCAILHSVVTQTRGDDVPRRLRSDFDDLLAQRGYSVRSFAKTYGLSHQTLFALLHPEWQPGQRPHGGMRKPTAWKLAKAWAQAAGLSPEESYAQIIVEDASDDR
jgi:hypothetical protein